jgi:thiol-disulfide isomerase/thioredoxin
MTTRALSAVLGFLIAGLATGAFADNFKTVDGKEYKNVTISRVEPDGIVLVTSAGISKVYFTELPKEVQARFHYDPAKGAAYSAQQAATQVAFQKQQEELRRKLAEEAQKNEQNRLRAAAAFVPQRGQPIAVISHGSHVDITKYLALGNVTIVDFYADWCPACRYISPSLEQMANADPEIALRKIDIVNWKTPVVKQFNLRSIPQVNIYNRRGNLVGSVGGADIEQVRRYVAQAKASG